MIHVNGKLDGAQLVICIDNPLPPAGTTNHRGGNQLAQDNIRQRLMACFGPSARLDIRTTPDHYYAEITIPYHAEDTHR